MTYDYDLFVIGAGSGGVRASRIAASYGAKVALAEESRVGGTCVIRGCVPKKFFVYASHFSESFEQARGFGWDASLPKFNWEMLVKNKNIEIDRLNSIYVRNLNKVGVNIIDGRAIIQDKHHVLINGKSISSKYILIAVGAVPNVADVEGKEHAITSNEAFNLKTLPQQITIYGGGYIALEFAGIFNGLGVDTTLIYRGNKLLKEFDEDIGKHLLEEMIKKGVKIKPNTQITKISPEKNKFKLTYNNQDTQSTDLVMFATGRTPYTGQLGLETAGIKTGAKQEIIIDKYNQTNIDNIYAVGDVTGATQLTPIAIKEGAAVAQTLFNNTPTSVDKSLIPTAIFTQPSVGTIGMSQKQAEENHDVKVYHTIFRPLKHTISNSDEKTMMKLIVDQKSDKILGLHIVGEDAAEILQGFAVAITMGATKADFDKTIPIHPTSAEEFVTFK